MSKARHTHTHIYAESIRSFKSVYYLFSKRQNFSELIKYIGLSVFCALQQSHMLKILYFRRGKIQFRLSL